MSNTTSNWEFSKENIQPLSVGRKMASLTSSLQTEGYKDLEPEEIATYKTLLANIKSYSGDDPVLPFVEIISFMDQYRLTSGHYAETMTKVEKRAVRKLVNMEKYQNDSRFISIYIRRLRSYELNNRIDMLESAIQNGLGDKVSIMYLALCDDYETKSMYRKASELLHSAIRNGAQPKEILEEALKNLEARVANYVARDMEQSDMDNDVGYSQRSFGHGMTVSKKNEAPSLRHDLPFAPASTSCLPTKTSLRKMEVFTDSSICSTKKAELIDINKRLAELEPQVENFMKPNKWNVNGLNTPERKEIVEKIPIFEDEETYEFKLQKGNPLRRLSTSKLPGLREVTIVEDGSNPTSVARMGASYQQEEDLDDFSSRSSMSALKDQMKGLRLVDTTRTGPSPLSNSIASREQHENVEQALSSAFSNERFSIPQGAFLVDADGDAVMTPSRRKPSSNGWKQGNDEPDCDEDRNDAWGTDAGQFYHQIEDGEATNEDRHFGLKALDLEEFKELESSYEESLARRRYPNNFCILLNLEAERLYYESLLRFEDERRTKEQREAYYKVFGEDYTTSVKAAIEALLKRPLETTFNVHGTVSHRSNTRSLLNGTLDAETENLPVPHQRPEEVVSPDKVEEHILVRDDSRPNSELPQAQSESNSDAPKTPRGSRVEQESLGHHKSCTSAKEKMLLGVGIPALAKRLEELEKEVRHLQEDNSRLQRQASRQSSMEDYMLKLEGRIAHLERSASSPARMSQEFLRNNVASENIDPCTSPARNGGFYQGSTSTVGTLSPRENLQKQIHEAMENDTSSMKSSIRRPSLGALTDLSFYRPPMVHPHEDYTEAIFKQPFGQEIEFNTSNITRALSLQPHPAQCSTPERPVAPQSFYGPEYFVAQGGMYSGGPPGTSSDRRSHFNHSMHEVAQNLSTIQETSKESRASTTGSSSSNMQTTRGVSGYNFSHSVQRWTSSTTPNPSHYYNSTNNY